MRKAIFKGWKGTMSIGGLYLICAIFFGSASEIILGFGAFMGWLGWALQERELEANAPRSIEQRKKALLNHDFTK